MNFRQALFIADSGNSRIKMLDSGDMSLYATIDGLTQLLEEPRTGPADDDNWQTNYYLGGNLATTGLGGMAYDGRWLYVGENTADKIYKVDPRYGKSNLPILKTGQFPSKPEGSGGDVIYDMCYWNGRLYVTNRRNTNTTTRDDIHIFETGGLTSVGVLSIPWDGSGDKPTPTGICTDGTYLYVLEGEPNPRIHKFYLTGEYVKPIGKYGTSIANSVPPEFIYPTGIDTDGDSLWVLDADSGNWRVNMVAISTEWQFARAGAFGCGDEQMKEGTVLKLDNTSVYLCVADSSANCPRVLKWHQYMAALEYIGKHGNTGAGGSGENDLDTAKSIAVLNPLVTPEGSLRETLFISNNTHVTIWDKDSLSAVKKLPIPPMIGNPPYYEIPLLCVAVYGDYLYAVYDWDMCVIVKYKMPEYTIEAWYDYEVSGTYTSHDITGICTDGEYLYLIDWYATDDYYPGDERGTVQKYKCSDLSYVGGAYFESVYPPYAEDSPYPGNDNYLWWPTQIDTDGEYLYVTSYDCGNIVKLKCSDLSYVDATTNAYNWGYNSPTKLSGCLGMCVSPDGLYVYYAESWNYHRMTKRRTSDWGVVVQTNNLGGPYGNGFGYDTTWLGWNHGMTTDGEYIYFGSGGDWYDPMTIRKHTCSSLSFFDWGGVHNYDRDFNPWIIGGVSNLDCLKIKKSEITPLDTPCETTNDPWLAGPPPGAREVGWIPFHMLEMYFDAGNFYISNSDRPLVWEGNSYACFPFTVEPARHSVGAFEETTKVSASGIDRAIASLVLSEKVEAKRVIVRKSYWTKTFTHTLPYVYFDGTVEGVSINEDAGKADVSFELKNDYWNWQRSIPTRYYTPTCNWRFKSTTPGCQYTGWATECDKSYERCTELENTDRFGGFRHMTKLEDYVVWWGKARGSSEGADLG